MATSEGIPSSIDIEFLELNDNPYFICQNKTNEDRTKGDCKLNVKDLKTRDVYLICLFTTNNKPQIRN